MQKTLNVQQAQKCDMLKNVQTIWNLRFQRNTVPAWKLEVFMAVKIKITVFWDVIMFRLVDRYQYFKGTSLPDNTVSHRTTHQSLFWHMSSHMRHEQCHCTEVQYKCCSSLFWWNTEMHYLSHTKLMQFLFPTFMLESSPKVLWQRVDVYVILAAGCLLVTTWLP